MKSFLTSLLIVLLLAPAALFSQSVINVYARVTAVSSTTLTITGSTGTFAAGQAIVMQMQDSTIGTNTGNNTGFGNLGHLQRHWSYPLVFPRTILASLSGNKGKVLEGLSLLFLIWNRDYVLNQTCRSPGCFLDTCRAGSAGDEIF